MKISELIKELSKIRMENGDLNVVIYNEYSGTHDHYQNVDELIVHDEQQVWVREVEAFVWVEVPRLEIA